VIHFERTPIPILISAAVPLAPLAKKAPPDVDPDDWARALDDTRLMLVAVASSGELDTEAVHDLGNSVAIRVSDATPKSARAVLTEIWDDAARRSLVVKDLPRPKLLY
jgi:hypothetical protein